MMHTMWNAAVGVVVLLVIVARLLVVVVIRRCVEKYQVRGQHNVHHLRVNDSGASDRIRECDRGIFRSIGRGCRDRDAAVCRFLG